MRNETIQLLYALVEEKVLARRGNRSERDHLAFLGHGLPALRKRYFTRKVVVDYTAPETVDSYLLAYFPHYIHTAGAAFAHVPCADLVKAAARGLDVVCIGGGPLPELIALVDRLLTCGVNHGTVNITSVDLNCTTWVDAVRDSAAIANVIAPDIRVNVLPNQRDCMAPNGFNQPIPACDVLVVQNCLNEIGHSSNFSSHATEFAAAVRRGGHLVVSDLTEYPDVSGVSTFEDFLTHSGFVALSRFDRDAAPVTSPFNYYTIPVLTREVFFGSYEDWRAPKSQLKFSTSAWRKK